MARVRQFFNREELEEPEGELKRLLEEKNLPIKKGSRIAITCGSRGIDGYVPLLKTIVAFVKEAFLFWYHRWGVMEERRREGRSWCWKSTESQRKP